MQMTSHSPATRGALWDRFQVKAEALGSVVTRVTTEEQAADRVSRAGTAAAGTRGLRGRFPTVAERCLPVPAIATPAPTVIAAGVFAVAETGSILLVEDARGRGACFLSEHLWLLVPVEEIVPTLDIALERLGALIADGAHHAVLMSGPSRTADIERTLTIGVHGPGQLTIVVVGDDSSNGAATP